MPRVSVIVPAYNAAAFLRDALDSVLRQTFQDWQVIVVDDGSTDGTRRVIETCMPAFEGRLHYVYQNNRGASAARNTAIAASCSELIALLDADDIWLEKRLELGIGVLDRCPQAGLVHAQVVRIGRDGEVLGTPPHPPEKYLSGRIAHHIYARRAHLLTPTVLFRRECLDAVGVFDEEQRCSEDRDLWFRIARRFDVAYLSEVVAQYRIVPDSLSRDWEVSRASQTRFLEKHFHAGNATQREYRQGLANIHRERGDVLFNRGKLAESIRWYAKAVSYDRRNLRNVYMLLRALGEPLVRSFASVESKA